MKSSCSWLIFLVILYFQLCYRAPPWSSSSVLDHRSLRRLFESWRGHIWRLFHLWPHFITFGGHAHLAYHVHKSGRKTSINHHHHHHCYIYLICRSAYINHIMPLLIMIIITNFYCANIRKKNRAQWRTQYRGW